MATTKYLTPRGTVEVIERDRVEGTKYAWLEYPNGERGRLEEIEIMRRVAKNEWEPMNQPSS